MEHAEAAHTQPTAQTADLDARFERLFREYQRPIASYLFRLVDDSRQAEELTQDVFLKAYRALGSLPAAANERAWLYRIATNSAYDLLRRRRLLQWLPLNPFHRAPGGGGGLEERIAEQDAVRQALAKVAPLYRIPLILYTVEGFSTAEIGEMLHVSANTVKVRVFRARQMFGDAYQGEAE